MKIIISGASGRMGRELIKKALINNNFEIIGATVKTDSEYLNQDIGDLVGVKNTGIKISSDILHLAKDADGILDFTNPLTSIENSIVAAQTRIVHVIGTTGFTADQQEKILLAAMHAKIIQSGNMSLGVNLLSELTRRAAETLNKNFDIEIIEMHHKKKIDAPSGTALLLGKSAAIGRKIDFDKNAIYNRNNITGEREINSIGFATLRGGSIIGEHDVIFSGDGETIKLSHSASDRGIFAQGALTAALWAKHKNPGLYSMLDVLDLK
ncbi:MAG: 4-hydroxy-tetrahydrodipicolinate reductase [Alphaproteobacteria bacterium]|jgi:4-hydroxy-tetrahydrodipicolinate reductase|tara:strand:- start:23855 stop:24655 length:801 start_codon:yes stop_codon:yes gene_type:complete